jgi:hypothetical protein
MATSSVTTQQLIDYARVFPWTVPAVGVAGYGKQPALAFANHIMQQIISKANPWKWNSQPFPVFYTQPYQQDYPTNISQNTIGWLESATIIDINNTQIPKPQPPIECVARILPTYLCDIPTEICWVPNTVAITAQWPGPNITYTNPVADPMTGMGGPANNPFTAITDPNGNIQVISEYGTTGSTPPSWPLSGATPGTITMDGSAEWTLADPDGVAIRVNALATNMSQVWAVVPIYQVKPPTVLSLSQTFAPIPDDLDYLIQQGFLAYCTKIADRKKFADEFAQWKDDIQEAMGASDREPQDFGMYPQSPIQGGGNGGGNGTFGYPGWPGWS